jgi:diphosphomevalonate decarboxylase
MKATAIAHPIQGLMKYHGLKKLKQRIPHHNSISVCIQALNTTTTVEASSSLKKNVIIINGEKQKGRGRERVEAVLNKLKELAGFSGNFKVVSENSLKVGKGLGFSASGFAALGVAACKALDLNLDTVSLSETVRLGAGSATRSLAGRFAIWHADKNGRSYAEQLDAPHIKEFSMVIVPVHSDVITDEAHAEVLSSPLFKARLRYVGNMLKTMEEAIKIGDVATIGWLAEEDTLNLHAITMTGKSHMVLWEPDTLRVIKEVIRMRKDGISAWYSIDTGPSVFINTHMENAEAVVKRLRERGFMKVLVSGVGEKPFLTSKHLF